MDEVVRASPTPARLTVRPSVAYRPGMLSAENASGASDSVDPAGYFESQGYFVFRQVIPSSDIDAFLNIYREVILPSRQRFLRQSSNRWERHDLTTHGYARNSFLDIHDVRADEVQEACRLARNVLCSRGVREALARITREPAHSLMQSMLFDLNTATPPHQDWQYLDSVPNGRLLAGWFALEDIHEDAGRFFVLPGSNKIRFDFTPDEMTSNALYVKKIGQYVETHRSEVVAPTLRKGDVLFWDSRTIHGSLPTRDERHSRKSFTGHYMPSWCEFGNNRGDVFPVLYRMQDGMPYRFNEKRYSLPYATWRAMDERLSVERPATHRLLKGVSHRIRRTLRRV